ncbi:hypothetical protein FAI40_04000 [Acetobacteraceae bacterium]|nr:hypothetical protein FAI40_04000 [Acetobacteraceae bacterium]
MTQPKTAYIKTMRTKSKSKESHIHPTKERLKKPDYEKKLNGKRERAKTLSELEKRKIISGAELNAAERWLSDYLFATEGYADALFDPPSEKSLALTEKYGRGDRHTFEMSKGKAWERIEKVRQSLGLCVHIRLKALLIDQLSFTAIGVLLYPEISEGRARDRASTQCALILEQLAEHYDRLSQAKAKKPKGKTTDIRSFGSFQNEGK